MGKEKCPALSEDLEKIRQHLWDYAELLDALAEGVPVRSVELQQEAGMVKQYAQGFNELMAHEIAGHYAKMRGMSETDLKKMADSVVETLLDSERLDFAIEKNFSFQRSAEGIYVKYLGFFPTGREAIDAAMRQDKEG